MSAYYFDDEEEGLARETSHPFFVEHATADFYFDGGDDFSPFGNDTGHDTLRDLEEWYQERRAGEKAVTFLRHLIQSWEFDLTYLAVTEPLQLDAIEPDTQYLNSSIDQAIIAIVFGQFKIAGKADKAMLSMAEAAFRRQRYIAEKAQKRQLNPWEHAAEYFSKIEILKADLATMANKKAR